MSPLRFLLLSAMSLALAAQPAPPATPITAAQRKAALETLTKELRARYVFPEVADKVAKAIQAKAASGGYDGDATVPAFAEALSKDLRAQGQDRHFRVMVDPDFKPEDEDEDRPPTPAEVAEARKEEAQRMYGIAKVERLPGNVGYMDLRGFGPTEIDGSAYTSALSLLSGTDALILDLRQNGGGSPEGVAFLMSHFFAEGDVRLINSIYNRPKDTTRQFWTVAVGVRYTQPVFVLTSPRTFSGGEECAYDFQTQKRGTLVGEVTGGGANPGAGVGLGSQMVVFIPTGKAINPVTHTNWEHVGVKPDVAVPAADALKTAYASILKGFIAKEKDPEQKQYLESTLARVEKGEARVPDYSRMQD
ncbi:MAG TPA: S41 family peptidase [Holophagaceae bacterium]|nr:S41 family peptidase [Holophagaceae bacterium]